MASATIQEELRARFGSEAVLDGVRPRYLRDETETRGARGARSHR